MQRETVILNKKIIPLFFGILLIGGLSLLLPLILEKKSGFMSYFLPYLFYLLFMVAIFLLLKLIKFRGDYLILVLYFLLSGIGVLYQLRLEYISNDFDYLNEKKYDIPNSAASNENNNDVVPKFNIKIPRFFLTTLAGGMSLLFVVILFSKKGINFFSRKYYILYLTTILFLLLMVIVSKFDKAGSFVFYRTPWELVKIALTLTLAGFFTDNYQLLKKEKFGIPVPSIYAFGPFLFLLFIPMILFVALGDFGQLILYSGFMVFFLFASTNKIGYLIIGITGIIFVPKLILLIRSIFPGYAIQRIENWQNIWMGFPASEWWDKNYQVINSMFAIRAGNATGTGMGMGFPKLVSLVKSDFVFSGISEEFGLLGSSLILLIYFLLIFRLFKVSFGAHTRFLKLSGIGLTLMLAFQIFINIGGVINLIPLTGITLPFLSRGGFSFITSSIIVGILMTISHGEKKIDKRLSKTHSGSQRRRTRRKR